jgi:hypothetical protein
MKKKYHFRSLLKFGCSLLLCLVTSYTYPETDELKKELGRLQGELSRAQQRKPIKKKTKKVPVIKTTVDRDGIVSHSVQGYRWEERVVGYEEPDQATIDKLKRQIAEVQSQIDRKGIHTPPTLGTPGLLDQYPELTEHPDLPE